MMEGATYAAPQMFYLLLVIAPFVYYLINNVKYISHHFRCAIRF